MKPLEYCNGVLKLIDQTLLPVEHKTVVLNNYVEIADAIKNMIVRGAPAIGVTAAYGLAIAAKSINTDSKNEFFDQLKKYATL